MQGDGKGSIAEVRRLVQQFVHGMVHMVIAGIVQGVHMEVEFQRHDGRDAKLKPALNLFSNTRIANNLLSVYISRQ
jgi:hypothetical protein